MNAPKTTTLQARPKAMARSPAPRMSALTAESVDNARRHLLVNARTAATLDAIEATDLRAVANRTSAAIEQLLAVARGRRRILTAHKTPAAVPIGVQRYHALLLEDAFAAVREALPEMRRLAVRLDVSGLNGDLSRFVAARVLTAPAAGTRPHTLRMRFEREEPKALTQLLTQAGLSAAAIDDVRTMTQAASDQIDIDVLAPGDRDYPGATGAGGGAGGGGGGVAGTAVDSAMGSIGLHTPKGISGLIDGMIEQVQGILDAARQQDWTYGFALADGTPTMNVDLGPRAKDLPPSPGGQLGGAGSALREFGGRLFLIGLAIGGPFAAIGLALYMIGLLLGVIGMAWDALASGSSAGTSFVDP